MFTNKKHIDFYNIDWKANQKLPIPLHEHVDIWKICLKASDSQLSDYWQILSTEEKDRALQFYFKKETNAFIVSRAMLKTLCANYLYLKPQEIQLSYGEFGKPYLKASNLDFNISHSAGQALMAFTSGSEIGIDIEKLNPDIEIEKLVKRFFSINEAKTVLALERSQRVTAFFKCWTRKEAFIKAVGKGLSFPLDQFDVTIHEEVKFLSINGDENLAEEWSLVSFAPEKNFTAAFSMKNKIKEINFYDFSKETQILQ